MRFNLVDRIEEVEPGRRIQTVKNLTLGEEYLSDHFPTFPVMPGVLMLQALVEASSWLLRISEDFKYSIILLRETKNVKYGQFVEPGHRMRLTVELVERAGKLATLKGRGGIEGKQTVSARILLENFNLRERHSSLEPVDQKLIAYFREQYRILTFEHQATALHAS